MTRSRVSESNTVPVTNRQDETHVNTSKLHSVMNLGTGSTRESPSPDELYELGDVLKFTYRVVASTLEPFLPVRSHKPFSSYAIYYGHGRVIHAWSNTRKDFRVRVDTLRSLEATGLVVANATQDMDAYCALVLGVTPLQPDAILPRARKALHSTAHDHTSSILLVLSARYGGIAIRMAKSFYLMLPHIVRRCGAMDMLADRLGEAVLGLLAQQPLPEGFRDPARLDADDAGLRAATSVWMEYSCELAAKALRGVKSLLTSDISDVLSLWVMLTFEKATQSPTSAQTTYGMILSQTGGHTASLSFNRAVQRFVLIFDSDKMLLERLVRDRMECGICFVSFENVRVKVFECSHYTCGGCFKNIRPRICPYCRAPIVAVREITSYLKLQAYEMMRAEECKLLAENDFDAPVFVPERTSGGEDPASPGYDGDEDGEIEDEDEVGTADYNAPATVAVAPVTEVRGAEATAMLVEDFDALALD